MTKFRMLPQGCNRHHQGPSLHFVGPFRNPHKKSCHVGRHPVNLAEFYSRGFCCFRMGFPEKKNRNLGTKLQNFPQKKTHQKKNGGHQQKILKSRIHAVTEFHPKWDEVASNFSAKMLLDQAILLMEEVLHHLGGFEPFEKYNIVKLDHFPRFGMKKKHTMYLNVTT